MFNIDLHIHTQRYSPCAEFLDPNALETIMLRRGLHGILLTEHDAVWPLDEVRRLQRKLGNLKVYRGCEVSTAEGHLVIIGTQDMQDIRRGMGLFQLSELIKRRGGASILVHPDRPSGESSTLDLNNLPRRISAIEVMSSSTSGLSEMIAREIANRYDLPMVAGSDAHALDQVGLAYTSFDHMPKDELELARAIDEGKGSPRRSLLESLACA